MLRKALLLTACLSILSAPMAFAGSGYSPNQPAAAGGRSAGVYQGYGLCYTEPNGTGEVINWVKSEMQCRTQSNGRSWADPAEVRNYDRGK